jgi:hypothetical protein
MTTHRHLVAKVCMKPLRVDGVTPLTLMLHTVQHVLDCRSEELARS